MDDAKSLKRVAEYVIESGDKCKRYKQIEKVSDKQIPIIFDMPDFHESLKPYCQSL